MEEMTVEDILNDAMIGEVLRADRIDPGWFATFLRETARQHRSGAERAVGSFPRGVIVDPVSSSSMQAACLLHSCNAQ